MLFALEPCCVAGIEVTLNGGAFDGPPPATPPPLDQVVAMSFNIAINIRGSGQGSPTTAIPPNILLPPFDIRGGSKTMSVAGGAATPLRITYYIRLCKRD